MTDAGAVLIVCTGNVCRSPYIERLLRAEIGDLGVTVTSAGTQALAGEPMQDGSAELLSQAGVDAEGFVARQLTPAMVEGADLVLTATREHRRSVVRTAPRGLRYVFAIDDFSDLVADAPGAVAPTGAVATTDDSLLSGDSTLSGGPPLSGLSSGSGGAIGRLLALASSRRADVAARTGDDSGIEDPFQQGPAAYARMASQVSQVLPPIVAAFRRLSPTP
ncbi:hypothetical protein [Allobranchiibius sp. CTAmp26]|uniref:arsenate reductase/protein-tyrosine-phosphatase family protein n=1 Tax=Allobranchiibius sp. CTAmp26 TaxID=2815214 RepID=UPI001AA18D02|nr:hypothetical protein [Allobranchiibius sp. CTAmp26]MBO1755777.1 hypothetical protein [Allobranchiibius sp. CTAmp26]